MPKENPSATDLLGDEDLSYYTKGMDFLYLQLVHLNVNIFILEHILAFPFHLFTIQGETLFFRMVFDIFFYASLLTITRLAADQGDDLLTLMRFKNKVRKVIKPEYQPIFDDRIKRAGFDDRTKALIKKARNLRHERVAHILEEVALERQEGATVVFGEIRELRDQLNLLLDALSFNTQHMMLPIQYDPHVQHPRGIDARPDIEVLLDSVAERSPMLRMPEREPRSWSYTRNDLSDGDVLLFNKYRRKFGLPEVP